MESGYPQFFRFIDNEDVRTVLELGARDCRDSVALRNHFDARVIAFECNPLSLHECEMTIDGENDIRLVPLAAWDTCTEISFYPVINGNNGASSAFVANRNYPFERYKQTEVKVSAVRLDEWWHENETGSVDLLCMDLQGSELRALRGMGDMLENIQFIITEVQFKPMYHNTPLVDDLVLFLHDYGFRVMEICKTRNEASEWFGDALFVKGN